MAYALDISRDRKEELRGLLKEKIKRKGKKDLFFFCKNILHYEDLSDNFHRDYCDHLESSDLYKLTLTPRGSLKSSIGSIGLPLQDIINNPDTRGLIASEKFSLSTKLLTELKGHIEKNDTFIGLYGDLVGKKWTESEIIVNTRKRWRKEPTVSCAGIDVTKVGMHYDWIVVDDPHSDQNTQNQDQIDKVIRWYKLLFSLLDPGGWMNITGTIWHYNDLYNYIQQKEIERLEAGRKPRFKVFKRDSFVGTLEDLMNDNIPEENFLWPERLSPDFLKDQYIEQGPYIFSCQYRLNPVDDETAIFKRSWIHTCKPEDIPKNLEIFTTVDPMRDEEGRDFLAVITCGMDTNWKAYILDVQRLKADEHQTVDTLFDVYEKWKPLRIGIESVAWQKSYVKYVKMISMLRGKYLPITQLKTDTRTSKGLRIKGMVPYWKAGFYIIPCKNRDLNKVTGNMAILVDELTRYPKTTNDDTIDALAYMNQISKRPSILHLVKKLHPRSFKALRDKAKKAKKKKKLGAHNIRKR